MKNFIKCHFIGDGEAIRINKSGINAFYWQRDTSRTRIITNDGEVYYVRETPLEIETAIEGIIYDAEKDPYKKIIVE